MPNTYKNRVVYNGTTLIDLSGDTVTSADHIVSGYIGHLADGSQVTGTGSGGSSSGQTKTGTVTGDGTTTLQIPCSFKPDLIYVYGDMSGAVSNRGVTSVTIIKDELIDIHSDASSSADSESLIYVSHDVTGYNEDDSSSPHATYSNGTLTIDMVANSASTRFLSGQVYTYELSTVGTGSGGSANVGTKTITANGTYDAGDDSLDGYSEVTVNVPDPADYTSASTALGISKPITSGITALTTYANEITGESDTNLSDAVRSLADGYGQGGEEETGTFTASEDGNPTILFSNSHTKAPAIVILMRVDTASSMPVLCGIFYVFTNVVDLFGVSLQTTQRLFRQGVHAYARTKSNGEAELGAAVLADTSTRVTTTGFTPYFGSANHVCRSGCTYKWIAIWTQGD